MTEYAKFTIQKSTLLLSHDNVLAAKEARRKILDAVFERRKELYKRWLKKMQLKPISDIDTIS